VNRDEQQFEEFLRGFEPRRPSMLPVSEVGNAWNWRRIAAAAALLLVCVGSIGIGYNTSRNGRQVARAGEARASSITQAPSIWLTRLALDDRTAFETRMDEIAPLILPCCEGPKSTLAALAKE